jgi:hypothetical protein
LGTPMDDNSSGDRRPSCRKHICHALESTSQVTGRAAPAPLRGEQGRAAPRRGGADHESQTQRREATGKLHRKRGLGWGLLDTAEAVCLVHLVSSHRPRFRQARTSSRSLTTSRGPARSGCAAETSSVLGILLSCVRSRVFFTVGNCAVYRSYRCYRGVR